MKISLVAAVARNRVIGSAGGGIPWKLPRDTVHFRSYTKGKWMLLGRKTFLEMAGWFTDQTPVVLTRSSDLKVPEGYRVNSIDEAIALAQDHDVDELVVCGGAAIYEVALPFVEEMLITRVDADFEGTAHFPDFEKAQWEEVSSQIWGEDQDNHFPMTIQKFLRKKKA